jgi:uncharacterized membrane protein HdeD (DUF308 family)
MKRPLTVTILGLLYIIVGVGSTAAHLFGKPSAKELVSISVLGLLAVVAGVFMLRAQNWARWLALAWMAFHVALSLFHPLRELIVHAAFLALFAYLLFRPEARAYFRAEVSAI